MRLETITLRSTQLQSLEARLPGLVADLSTGPQAPSVAVYRRNPPTSDLCVHLIWSSYREDVDHFGIRVAAALGEYGTVDHAVWRRLASSRPVF